MKHTNRGPVCIVDAYRSGELLIEAFRGYNVTEFFHVRASRHLEKLYDTPASRTQFSASWSWSKRASQSILCDLWKIRPLCVVAGTETGVEVADLLSQRLGLQTNGTALSRARRNKYDMVAILKTNGLAHIPSHKLNAAVDIAGIPFSGPFVVKPLRSAGGDCVRNCRNLEQVRVLLDSIQRRQNRLACRNRGALLQKQIFGSEYIVDTVSCNARHRIAACWKVTRVPGNGAPFLCRTTTLLPENEIPEGLIVYAFSVLNALSICYGPAHMEFKVDSETGLPVLIEIGARLHGDCFPKLTIRALKKPQHILTAQAYLAPRQFLRDASAGYELKQHLTILEWISPRAGVVANTNKRAQALNALRELPSFFDCLVPLAGESISRTVDVFTSPGWVAFSHKSRECIDIDVATAQQLEDSLLRTT